jgi:protein tyrosine phosphatase
MSSLLQPWKASHRCVMVHCSAGIGRTGTFCAIDALLHRLRGLAPTGLTEAEARWHLDVPAVVFQLRQQRMGMVQTPQQYMYCYVTLREAALQLATLSGAGGK